MTRIKNICVFAVMVAASAMLTGCQFSNKLVPTAHSVAGSSSGSTSSTGSSGSSPSAAAETAAVAAAAGTWASPTIAGLPNISSCTNLQWHISSQSATSVAGSVSAVCGGVVNVNADLTGQMSASDVVN